VTNSSSSSFIISKKHLDNDQIKAIWNHIELAKLMGDRYADYLDAWNIREDNEYITGDTWMDNFSMSGFLKNINVDMKKVSWEEYPFNLNTYYDNKNYEDEEEIDEWRDLLAEI
jgi:hypothetical protein